jgi:hypothetical protein
MAVEITPDGMRKQRNRIAYRVLSKEGRKCAAARATYNSADGRLRSLNAWIVHPGGKVSELSKKKMVDRASYSSALELYGEYREAVLRGGDEVTPGCVFAFEATTEGKQVFAQDTFHFQWPFPAEQATYSITVPQGWKVKGRVFNHAPMEPVVSGRTSTWSIRGLPAAPDEVMAPSHYVSGPWLGVDIVRPEGTKGTGTSWVFESWQSVSEHFTPYFDAGAQPDNAIRERASSVAAGSASQWDTIRSLSAHAQRINYISITLDAGSGGGLIPRPAARVLACGYGDCKDKSTLLLSLLRTQGIETYPVFVFSGDPARVREAWPSPLQFNHCIVAIKVADEVDGPAVVDHPSLGRLLFFDPTNPYAPAGILPAECQSSMALVAAGAAGTLVRLPSATSQDNRLVRRIHARLDDLGGVSGSIQEEFAGNASVDVRREVRSSSPTAFKELIERWLGRTLPAARAKRVENTDDFDRAVITLNIDFEAPTHGRLMRDELLVFKPVLVGRRGSHFLKQGERRSPIVFEALSITETAVFELPAGFRIDEMIEPVDVVSPFGRYTAGGRLNGEGKLVFERTLTLNPTVVPASDYANVRAFYERIVQAEQSPIVLARVPAF